MKERDEILKAQQDRISHINDAFIKGKDMPIGSTSIHGGVKVKKTAAGKWEPVKEPKKTKESEGKEGSVIGKTKSGKSIYAKSGPAHYKNFTTQDHIDAAEAHSKAMDDANSNKEYDHHYARGEHHKNAAGGDESAGFYEEKKYQHPAESSHGKIISDDKFGKTLSDLIKKYGKPIQNETLQSVNHVWHTANETVTLTYGMRGGGNFLTREKKPETPSISTIQSYLRATTRNITEAITEVSEAHNISREEATKLLAEADNKNKQEKKENEKFPTYRQYLIDQGTKSGDKDLVNYAKNAGVGALKQRALTDADWKEKSNIVDDKSSQTVNDYVDEKVSEIRGSDIAGDMEYWKDDLSHELFDEGYTDKEVEAFFQEFKTNIQAKVIDEGVLAGEADDDDKIDDWTETPTSISELKGTSVEVPRGMTHFQLLPVDYNRGSAVVDVVIAFMTDKGKEKWGDKITGNY